MKQWRDYIWMKGHITWLADDTTVKSLPYEREEFNDDDQMKTWQLQGFSPRTGKLYDMRHADQPALTKKLIEYVEKQGLEHVGVSYYCMLSGDNLPHHSDTYKKYISVYNLEERKQNIVRYIFFPEARKSGHIFEVNGNLLDWAAGDWIAWAYNTPHLAANFGLDPRYSIQVTGVLREGF